MQQPSHNTLWFLIARSLASEASPEEEQTLNQILQSDPSLQQQYDLLKRIWQFENNTDKNIEENKKENISHILQMAFLEKATMREDTQYPFLRIKNRKKIILFSLGSAAAVIILVYAALLFLKNDTIATTVKNQSRNTQTLIAENGSRTRTILPDGSTVLLNAGSHISYNKDFSGGTREITLDGEAYFDVVKDARHPFIVHVANYDIRVLGTTFNVKSYTTDKTVETTLLKGLVQVTKHDAKKPILIYLHPNEKLIVEKNAANVEAKLPDTKLPDPQKNYTIKTIDSALKKTDIIETAWVYNRLEFNGDEFEEVAGKLERWYNVTIIFDDDKVKKLHPHGSFENETIEQALAYLKIAMPFNYEIQGKEIHIKSVEKNK